MDIIRCDEPNYLIWKWHPYDVQSGANSRENSIRWGSSLRVKDGEVAVFVYNQPDGTKQDYIVGPFDSLIETTNFPVLTSIIGFAYKGESPFQAEIYFINLAKIIQVRFGVPYFDVFDPRFVDFGVPIAVRGTISFKISDYRQFIKLHRLISFDLNDFQNQIRDAVSRYVKDAVANAPAMNDIPLVQIETKISQINDVIEYDLGNRLKENFGVDVTGIDISAIDLDKSSEGYRQLMSVTKDLSGAVAKAESEAIVKDIKDKQQVDIENYGEELRIRREEQQYAQHKQTQTGNLEAFKIEEQSKVGVAGAEALGQMGANGAGSVDLGNGGGFNPSAMVAGMAIGSAVGQNISGTLNNMMSGINQAPPSATDVPPSLTYFVAVNGQSAGPFDINVLKQMAESGQFCRESMVWRSGMKDWAKAGTVIGLKDIFDSVPPAVPNC